MLAEAIDEHWACEDELAQRAHGDGRVGGKVYPTHACNGARLTRQWTRAECKNFKQGMAGAAVGKLKRREVKGDGEAGKVSTDVGSATIDAYESVRTGAAEPPVGGPVQVRVPGEEIVITAAKAEGVTWV